jgi:hypothetical protein
MMLEVLQPTQDPDWVLSHDGYSVLTESAVEPCFAFGNGFLGMRAARLFSRGPTWVGWMGYGNGHHVPNIKPPVPALLPCRRLARAATSGRALINRSHSRIPENIRYREVIRKAYTHLELYRR